MSNFFSQPWFLETAARVLFPGGRARPATVRIEGQRYDLLLLPRGQLASVPVVDFFEPRDPTLPEHGAERTLDFLPRALLGVRAILPDAPALAANQRLAPYVDWSEFSSWQQFVERSHKAQWRAFHQSERKLRKIGRERGAVRIEDCSWDHGLLERLLTWKARQLRSTGRYDTFASTRLRQLLHELLDMKRLHLCALYAGDQPISALLMASSQGRTSCWISGYDPRVANYSPGALIFEHALKLSHQAGDREFDMLIGDEDYKYHYATHERLIGPLGRPSPVWQALVAGRAWLEKDVAWRAELRGRGFALMQDRSRRQRLTRAADPLPDWAPDLLANNRSWPAPRIRSRADCQLQSLQEWTDAHRSGPDRLRAELNAADKAARALVRVQRDRLAKARGPKEQGAKEQGAKEQSADPIARPLPLSSGDHVRVKTEAEIMATLNGSSRDGLYYIRAVMRPMQGKTFTVERPVKRFYDERTRQVVRPRRAVALAGASCDGSQLGSAGSCDRACLLFWHEDWLERVEEAPAEAASGERVRIRSAAEITTIEARREAQDGIVFTPATMAVFCGSEARVAGPMKRAYDERAGQFSTLNGVLTLQGLRCPGAKLTSGDPCDRACTLFWREEWLERLPGSARAGQ